MADQTELRIVAAFDDAIRGMQQVRQEMSRTAGHADTVSKSGMTAGQRFATGLAAAGPALRKTGGQLQGVGREMTTGITLPLAALGGVTTKMAVDFDSSFTRIRGLVGESREQTDQWSSDILDLSGKVGRPPQELADALFFVASAGIKGADAIDTVEASAKAAAAGLGDTSTIADAATSAMNAYGAENVSATDAVDVLVASIREGKLEPAELAGVLGRVIPFASELGVEFHEVGAAIAAMSRSGIDAAEGTTALRQIMQALIKPTAQGEERLAEMGLTFGDLRGQLKEGGLLQLLGFLKDSFGDNEEALADIIPGIQGLGGFLNLMGENAEENAQIFDNLAESTGDLNDAFAETEQDTGFQMQQMLAELKVLAIELGQALIPFLKEFIGIFKESVLPVLRQAVEWFSNLPKPMQGMIVKGLALLAVLGPLLVVFGSLLKTVGLFLTPISKFAGLFVKGAGGISKFGKFLGILKTAFIGLATVIKTVVIGAFNLILAHPIIAAIALIIGIVILLIKHWDTVGPFFKKVWDAVVGFFQMAWENIKGVISSAIALIKQIFLNFTPLGLIIKHWDGIVDFFRNLWDSAKEAIGKAIDTIKDIFLNFTPLGLIIKHWEVITGFFSNLWESAKDAIASAIQTIKDIFFNFHPLGLIIKHWEVITGFFSDLWSNVKATISGAVDSIKSTLTSIGDTIRAVIGFFRNMWGGIKSGIQRVVDGIKSKVQEAKAWLGRLNPFSRSSPSLVENVQAGTAIIATEYQKLEDIDIDLPRLKARLTAEVDAETTIGGAIPGVQDVRIVDSLVEFGGGEATTRTSDSGVGSDVNELRESIVGAVNDEGELLTDVLGKYLKAIAQDGDHLNDWLTHMPDWLRDQAEPLGARLSEIQDRLKDDPKALKGFENYLKTIVENGGAQGDYLNDFLTHIPEEFRTQTRILGEKLAGIVEAGRPVKDAVVASGQSVASAVTSSGRAMSGSVSGGSSLTDVVGAARAMDNSIREQERRLAARVEGGTHATRKVDESVQKLPDHLVNQLNRGRSGGNQPDHLTGELDRGKSTRKKISDGVFGSLLPGDRKALATPSKAIKPEVRMVDRPGGVTYNVYNPKKEETEDSLRKISTRRTYLGADGSDDRKLTGGTGGGGGVRVI